MTFRKAVHSLAVLLLATAPLTLAQGTYTQIDYPGSIFTEGYSIDTNGDIVGTYVDTSDNYHGFLLSGVTYTTIDYPGGAGTYLFGLNDVGQIVGLGGNSFGFLYDEQAQTFTAINYPHANETFPNAINNAGTIVGSVNYGKNVNSGFALVSSSYKRVSPPGTIQSLAAGVTESNEIVGNVFKTGETLNFLFSRGKYEALTMPNVPGAQVTGINPTGTTVVGFYTTSSGIISGFLYQNSTLTTLLFPGSIQTQAYGINAAGEVVGLFVDTNFVYHAFTWTPPADAKKK
jgi:probable HAF family extracellular repeat protein